MLNVNNKNIYNCSEKDINICFSLSSMLSYIASMVQVLPKFTCDWGAWCNVDMWDLDLV